MPGCCLGVLLLFFGPRVVLFLAWWLTNWYLAFNSTLLAIAGFIFLPWTSLAWMYAYFHDHGHLSGIYLIVLIVAVIVDLGAYGGGHRMRNWRSESS